MRRRIIGQYLGFLAVAALGIVAVLFLHDPVFLAVFTFAAVVAAAMLIAWAAEASQFSVSQGLALAVVAIVQTLPEFFVEGTIAWKAGKDLTGFWLSNVAANFTGANRLLTGLGWPLILFTAMIQRRRNGQKGANVIALHREHSVEVVFMLAASLYYVVIIVKGTITLVDTAVLMGSFIAYMLVLSRLPSEEEDPKEVLEGSPLVLVELKRTSHKALAITGLFAFSGLVFVLISDPFVESIRSIAEIFLGAGAVFFFIQWIAPFLSEFPEKVTAFNWARKIRLAPMALLNFVSSSVNELTALVAIIPVVFIISRGALDPVSIALHRDEVLLTMAQSLYACASLLDLEYDARNAGVLFGLWLYSTAVVDSRFYVSVLFLVLAAVEVALHRGHITAFSSFWATVREHVRK